MIDVIERLRRCLRFDEPTSVESELEAAAREAIGEIELLRKALREQDGMEYFGQRFDRQLNRADAAEKQLGKALEALSWYQGEAEAAAKHMINKPANADALAAILTVLALDGGSRARKIIGRE